MTWTLTKEQIEGVEKLFDFYVKNISRITPFGLRHSLQGIEWDDEEIDYNKIWNEEEWNTFLLDSLRVLIDTLKKIREERNYIYNKRVKNRLNMLRKLRENWNMSIDEYEKIYGINPRG